MDSEQGLKPERRKKEKPPPGPDPEAKAPGAKCSLCPAKKGRMLPSLPPAAGRRLKLLVVGEAPCASDLQAGEVFQSGGARLLQRGLDTIGVRRSEVFWTNAVLCQCKFKVLEKAAKCCQERLRLEVEAAGAKVVVPLGGAPTKAVLGWKKKTPIAKWRGSVMARERDFVLPIMHPAEVRKAPKWGPILEVDVERIGRVMVDGFVPPEEIAGRRTIIARTVEDLEALEGLESVVAFDVETVGLGPTKTSLVCFGIGDRRATVVIPWSDASNGLNGFWTAPGEVLRRVNACLKKRRVVTHNGFAFDHIVAERYGIEIAPGGAEDTLLMSHAVAGHMPKGLAHVVTAAGIDVPPWKMLEERGADFELLLRYNGRDVLYTILAWHELCAKVV